MWLNKKAQATTELAIFGSLILVIFGALLSYGQRLNEEQAVNMDAFRYALQKAGQDNGYVSYTVIKNRNLYDLMGSFLNPQSSAFSASASVLWSKGDSESKSYYRVNDDERELERIKKNRVDDDGKNVKDADGDVIQDSIPVEVWDSQTQGATSYAENTEKAEDAGGITTTQSAALKDRVYMVLKTRFDQSTDKDTEDYINKEDVIFDQCLYRDNNGVLRYSAAKCSSDTGVYKEKKWSTPW